jgi:hypothetical protein
VGVSSGETTRIIPKLDSDRDTRNNECPVALVAYTKREDEAGIGISAVIVT